MPNFARLHYPGSLVHVIARIVDRRFLIAGPAERAAYLDRIPAALARTDWSVLAYGLMSNHVHLVLVAGDAPPWRLYQSLHASFAAWLNGAHGRLGPLFAGRPQTIYMPLERTGQLVTYVHNNPVRAGIVEEAADSDWTSHRAWLGLDTAPRWLQVERGLAEAGFGVTTRGRAAFDEHVRDRRSVPRDPVLSGDLAEARAALREHLALPVEVSSSVATPGPFQASEVALRHCGILPTYPRWPGDLRELVVCVAEDLRISVVEVHSRSHAAAIVLARRLVVVTGVLLLRRRTNEVAAVLGVSDPSVSRHLRFAETVIEAALRIEARLRGLGDERLLAA